MHIILIIILALPVIVTGFKISDEILLAGVLVAFIVMLPYIVSDFLADFIKDDQFFIYQKLELVDYIAIDFDELISLASAHLDKTVWSNIIEFGDAVYACPGLILDTMELESELAILSIFDENLQSLAQSKASMDSDFFSKLSSIDLNLLTTDFLFNDGSVVKTTKTNIADYLNFNGEAEEDNKGEDKGVFETFNISLHAVDFSSFRTEADFKQMQSEFGSICALPGLPSKLEDKNDEDSSPDTAYSSIIGVDHEIDINANYSTDASELALESNAITVADSELAYLTGAGEIAERNTFDDIFIEGEVSEDDDNEEQTFTFNSNEEQTFNSRMVEQRELHFSLSASEQLDWEHFFKPDVYFVDQNCDDGSLTNSMFAVAGKVFVDADDDGNGNEDEEKAYSYANGEILPEEGGAVIETNLSQILDTFELAIGPDGESESSFYEDEDGSGFNDLDSTEFAAVIDDSMLDVDQAEKVEDDNSNFPLDFGSKLFETDTADFSNENQIRDLSSELNDEDRQIIHSSLVEPYLKNFSDLTSSDLTILAMQLYIDSEFVCSYSTAGEFCPPSRLIGGYRTFDRKPGYFERKDGEIKRGELDEEEAEELYSDEQSEEAVKDRIELQVEKFRKKLEEEYFENNYINDDDYEEEQEEEQQEEEDEEDPEISKIFNDEYYDKYYKEHELGLDEEYEEEELLINEFFKNTEPKQ